MTSAQLADLLEEAARRLRDGGPKGRIFLVSPGEFSERSGLNVKTVQAMCRRGEIVARKVARSWQIDAEASDRALSLRFGNAAERDLMRRK